MKTTILSSLAVAGLAAGTLMLAPPASATSIGGQDGEAVVYLPQCSKGASQTDATVADCSYSYLTKKVAPAYTYLTSQGYVLWNKGTLTSRALNFPAASQTWPKLTSLFGGASSTATPIDITGTVDENGRVELQVAFETFLDSSLGKCTLSGTVQLSSDATDSLGKGVGKAYDPATGRFAVASATPATPKLTPAPGSSCGAVNVAYDVSKGMGWYLSGYLIIPGGQAPVIPPPAEGGSDIKVQEASVKTPKKIAKSGKTVILQKAVKTNAGQKATAKLTWSTKKSAKGTAKKFASVQTTKKGKVTITTTGKAKKFYVKLTLKAPKKGEYQAYNYTKTWNVK